MLQNIERAKEIVQTMPSEHLRPPTTGENFGNCDQTVSDRAKGRLQAYAFSKGFLVVTESSSIPCGRIDFKCAHHGAAPRNHKERPVTATAVSQKEFKERGGVAEDGVTKLRERQTLNRKLNCKWHVYISRRKKDNSWLLAVKELEHNHPLMDNPFEYPEHLPQDGNYINQLPELACMKAAGVPHSHAVNIMPADGNIIRRRAYYNNNYDRPIVGEPALHVIERIFRLLDEANMHCYLQYSSILLADGKTLMKRLDALFFTTFRQVELAMKYAAGAMIQVNATCSTNKHKMPLVSNIGVSSSSSTFIIGLCLICTQNEVDLTHNLRCMEDLIWKNSAAPAVIVTNQGSALIKAVRQYTPLPNTSFVYGTYIGTFGLRYVLHEREHQHRRKRL